MLSTLPVVGEVLFSYGFLTYFSIVLTVVLSWFLYRTRKGLNLRAVGENAATADAAGVNVTAYKYLATLVGGVLAGLGGLYFVMEYTGGTWVNNGFGDRGWLPLRWVDLRPLAAAQLPSGAASSSAGCTSLSLHSRPGSQHAGNSSRPCPMW